MPNHSTLWNSRGKVVYVKPKDRKLHTLHTLLDKIKYLECVEMATEGGGADNVIYVKMKSTK